MAQRNVKITVLVDAELEEIVPGYLENRRNDVGSLLQALERGDYETIRILGHGMKGSGGGFGFDAITEMGHLLEIAAKEENTEAIGKTVGELSAYLERVEVVYG